VSAVSLCEVTVDNLNAVLALSVRPDQQHLVASNAKSIAQAHFEEKAWFRAVCVDDAPGGFLMVAHDAKDSVDFLWRMMIGTQYQGHGYGRQAIGLLIEETRAQRPHIEAIVLSHLPAAGNAGPFYERLGFTYTGEVIDSEQVMRIGL
jgi:diamine N-acetyltransferase